MIDAKEIRIGNHYDRKHGKGRTLTVMDEKIMGKIFSDDDNEYALNDFEPIQLAPDILILHCFDHEHHVINEYEEEERYTLKIGEDNKYAVCFVTETYGGKTHKYIRLRRDDDILYPFNFEYFHQLQNIMFDLSSYEFSL